MNDLPTIVVAAGGLLTTLAGSVGALWRHFDKKFDAINEKLEKCETRDEANRNGLHVVSMGCALLIEEVRGVNPSNRALHRVSTLLKTAFPVDPHNSPSWKGMLDALEEAQKS